MAVVQTSWTVRSLLAWGKDWLARKGVDNPRLDAELLLAHALGCDRIRLYSEFDKPLAADELSRARPLFERRGQREPVAYILGVKEFYGRAFKVGPGVFIPRPETELLVQIALEGLPPGPVHVLDLCGGSGAVGVSLAAEREEAHVDVVDIADAAVAATTENAALHAPGRVTVFRGDLYAALPERRRYDGVLANPPYVGTDEQGRLAPDIVRHEPHEALFAGEQGLDVLRRIVGEAPDWLTPDGLFATEIDPGQAAAVLALCTQASLCGTKVVRDLAGLDRHVVARAARR
ncbi:MAG: peptide chain release factor N(5)-glutamine methyltransferase [Myxococcales bacterium]